MSDNTHALPIAIIGGGPAGLTAALELIERGGPRPIVLEALDDVGGISRTIEYKGNRMDIGGHRFFSKSDWVMNWWRHILPLPALDGASDDLLGVVPPEKDVMLLRSRLSRIYFLRRFFDYPISLTAQTMKNLGLVRLMKIGVSYTWAMCFPRKPERHLEDFFINRFGGELYRTFFKDYTEKVWGVRCHEISPEWGAQRIKGLSITKALVHAAKRLAGEGSKKGDVSQKQVETSLIERFLYPKFGPGQMWRLVADRVRAGGGEVRFGCTVSGVRHANGRVSHVIYRDAEGQLQEIACQAAISSMPIKELVPALEPAAPEDVKRVASGLAYRDFLTVGLLIKKLKPGPHTPVGDGRNLLPDTWIYIQEPDVRIGRLQIFNNWSPALVKEPGTVWLGLEYFCFENDDLWSRSDADMGKLAAAELAKIDLIEEDDVLDFHVARIPKAYPAYFGTYGEFDILRQYTDSLANLYLVGRNGMHRYNNQDHSMLTAKLAVEDILKGCVSKEAIWTVNVEEEYHEEKAG